MSHFVRMFQPRFAPLVESGAKLQTIRPTPKRMPKPGDTISLRAWTGKPYRSKQRVLRESVIAEVAPIKISKEAVLLNGTTRFGGKQLQDFAHEDGFMTFFDMIRWFSQNHSLPFEGILIKWKL